VVHRKSHSARAAGAIWRTVKCVGCGCEFLYRMQRDAKATKFDVAMMSDDEMTMATSSEAWALLAHRLHAECDAVPCPDCGIYQPDMVAMLRKRYSRLPYVAGIVAIAVWAIHIIGVALRNHRDSFRPAIQMLGPPFGYLLIGALFAIGVGVFIHMTFDPNKYSSQRAGTLPPGPNGPIRKADFTLTDDQLGVMGKS